jgi:arabinofuranosyltransferase
VEALKSALGPAVVTDVAATLERVVAPPEPVVRDAHSHPWRRVATLALLLLPVVVILWCGWQRRWTADDGFINLRIVRQIVDGHGPVFNVGQRVETGTSPLWVALLALLDVVLPLRLEWIAALTGLLTTAGAVAVATFATRRALSTIGVGGVALPLGALAYVCVPATWDFATSGLETGLALLWLASAWWLLCGRLAPGDGSRVRWYVPVVLGLGPLVRPDFLIFSVGFVLALLLLSERAHALRIIGLAAALPVVAELARMAWFASLVPNTAMAKEASLSNWSRGWDYFVDFVGTYALVLPLIALAVLAWLPLRRKGNEGPVRRFVLLAAIVTASAGAQAMFVVRVGGDFMHARLLLPALFALLLPVAVVVVKGWARWVALGVAMWGVAAMFALRPVYSQHATLDGPYGAVQAIDPVTGIGDERLYYTRSAGETHPVTIDDYLRHDLWAQWGRDTRRLADTSARPQLVLLALSDDPVVVPLRRGATRTVASAKNLGVFGYAAGTDVVVIDNHGLADVVAGHLRLRTRGRPGHEKALPDVWTFARYAAPGAPLPRGMSERQVAAARRALSCGPLRSLVAGTEGTWSIGDAPGNLLEALRSLRFRFDEDPRVAAREVCG